MKATRGIATPPPRSIRRFPDSHRFQSSEVDPQGSKGNLAHVEHRESGQKLIRPDKPEAILNTHVPYSSLLGGGIECRRHEVPLTLKERLDGSEGVELTSGALKQSKSFRASARQISQLAKAGFFVPYSLGPAK
jgi:hypothetical protein